MGQDEATGTSWSSYDQSFREDAHQLLVWGYNDSRHRVTSDLEETEVTGFIVEAIETKLSAPDMDERFDRYSIKEDNPVPGEGRTGKRRRRMDVIVECTYRPRHKQRPLSSRTCKRSQARRSSRPHRRRDCRHHPGTSSTDRRSCCGARGIANHRGIDQSGCYSILD